MPYPEGYTGARHDETQGSDEFADDGAEMEWIEAALVLLNQAAEKLRSSEAHSWRLREMCHEAGATCEGIAAKIKGMMP